MPWFYTKRLFKHTGISHQCTTQTKYNKLSHYASRPQNYTPLSRVSGLFDLPPLRSGVAGRQLLEYLPEWASCVGFGHGEHTGLPRERYQRASQARHVINKITLQAGFLVSLWGLTWQLHCVCLRSWHANVMKFYSSIGKVNLRPTGTTYFPPPTGGGGGGKNGQISAPIGRREKQKKNGRKLVKKWCRRRLSAEGAKPKSNNRWKSDLGPECMYRVFHSRVTDYNQRIL